MDDQLERATRHPVSPVIAWLAAAELLVGIGALVLIGATNPLYYLLIVVVAAVVVLVVAADERRRARGGAAAARRAAVAAVIATEAGSAPAAPGVDRSSEVATGPGPERVVSPAASAAVLQSKSEEFVAALISYGMRVGVRTITRADREGWASALGVEYELLRAASCCAENDRHVVGELVTWDSVSVLHQLDTGPADGSGIARSVVAPYGRLPAATRVPVRRDPARVSCEVATLALDPRVANEYALHLLWRGIYDHARRGGATDVVWTLAVDLAALWREHYGFPLSYLGDGKRAPSGTAVTIVISLAELEQKLLRERPAYFGWMTVAFTDAERAALGLPVDLSAAYERVCGYVMAQLETARLPLVLQ